VRVELWSRQLGRLEAAVIGCLTSTYGQQQQQQQPATPMRTLFYLWIYLKKEREKKNSGVFPRKIGYLSAQKHVF
jgi:hypothetical protein